jgi:hypothetical protein
MWGMQMEPEEILARQALINRMGYRQRIIDTGEAQEEASKATAYTGYDPATGMARLQDSSGDISYGKAQTNGAVGIGDNIRSRRGGVLLGFDSMPHVPKKSTEPNIEKSSIVVGLLVDKAFGYGDDISDTYYSGWYPTVNYNSSLSINSKRYIFLGSGLVDMRPIGLFIGKLTGSSLKELDIIQDIPGFEISTISQFYGTDDGVKVFEKDNYYTMGYDGAILKFLGKSLSSSVDDEGTYIGTSFVNMAQMSLEVIGFNAATKQVSSETLTFHNTTSVVDFYVPQYIQESDTTWNDKTVAIVTTANNRGNPYSQTVKYKSADGSVNYVLLSGGRIFDQSELAIGLLIWDIGTIDNLESKDNIASHIGFNWSDVDQGGDGSFLFLRRRGIFPFDCYGAIGGIVIAIQIPFRTEPQFDVTLDFTEIFIPEQFLKGTNGIKINPSDLILSANTDIYESDVNNAPFYGEKLSGTIGTMPSPLEKRTLTCPYKLPKYKNNPYQINDAPLGQRETALILYSKFDSEKRKQVFGK